LVSESGVIAAEFGVYVTEFGAIAI